MKKLLLLSLTLFSTLILTACGQNLNGTYKGELASKSGSLFSYKEFNIGEYDVSSNMTLSINNDRATVTVTTTVNDESDSTSYPATIDKKAKTITITSDSGEDVMSYQVAKNGDITLDSNGSSITLTKEK